MIWRNNEGYYDPTAGQAITNIQRQEKRKERSDKRKQKRKENRKARSVSNKIEVNRNGEEAH